jgi:hypothetical protein
LASAFAFLSELTNGIVLYSKSMSGNWINIDLPNCSVDNPVPSEIK